MSDLDIMINLLANTKGMEASYKNAAVQQVSLNRHFNNGQVAANKAAAGLNNVEKQSSQLTGSLRGVGTAAAATFGVFALKSAALDIKDQLADYQDFRSRLQFLSGDVQTYQTNLQFLDDLSQEHGKSMLALGSAYTNLAALQRGNIITLNESQQLTAGLSNASSALGANTDQLSLVYYGLGQALSQPKVQAQELNQVVEPLPGLLQELTKAAGLTDKSFRDLVIEGEVTSTMFKDILLKALASYDGAAKANIKNINAQETALENMRVKAVKAFEEPINNVYGQLLNITSSGLEKLTKNAEGVTTTLEVLITAGLIRGAAALGNYAVQTQATVRANLEKIASDKAAAASSVALATADNKRAQGLLVLAQRELQMASNTNARQRATTELARVNQAAVASQNALTAATARYAATATTAATVARGLYAAVGGLPGILLLGGYALYQFATANDEASEAAKRHQDSLENLKREMNPFADYTRTQATGALQRYTGQLANATQQAEEMRARFENPFFKTTVEEVQTADKRVEELTQKVAALQKVLGDFQQTDSKSSGIGFDVEALQKEIDTQKKAADDLLENLSKQTTLYGQTSNEAKLRYELESGKLTTINDQTREKLLLEARQLDALEQRTADEAKAAKLEDDRAKAVDAVVASMSEQISLYGDTSREAQLRYDLESGKLTVINDQLREKLLLEARQLDALDKQKAFQSKFERVSASLQTPTQNENSQNQDNLGVLNQALAETPESEVEKRQQINLLIQAEERRHQAALVEIAKEGSSQYQQLWENTVERFSAGIGDSVADALFESETLGDGLRNVLLSTAKQAISTLIQIQLQRAIMGNANQAMTIKEGAVAATTAATTGTTITASMAPAAGFSSLASFGGNSVAAIAGMLAVSALLPKLFAGLFDNGGYIPSGQFGIAGEIGPEIVQGPAYVTSRRDTSKLLNKTNGNTGSVSGESMSITVIDKKTINIQGSSEEQRAELSAALSQSNQQLVAQISRDIGRGQGSIYTAIKRAS